MRSLQNLKEVRERLLGYRLDSVAHLSALSTERLRAIEAGDDPSFYELDRLARVYGIDADTLIDEPIRLAPGDSMGVLSTTDEFKKADDMTRASIVAAANAAHDVAELYQLKYDASPLPRFLQQRPQMSLDQRQKIAQPHQWGAELARQLRSHYKLGNEPIASMRDFVRDAFPSLFVLYAALGAYGPTGLSFADPVRGPAIVLNSHGKNIIPRVRRFSLARELYHLLVDWDGREPWASISGYFQERNRERERSANAFAIRFLCPPLSDAERDRDRNLHAKYGLPYAAWRTYLGHERYTDLPRAGEPGVEEAHWSRAEETHNVENFPLQNVPIERRTSIAELAAALYSEGRISRDEFADMLGVTPAAEMERVLDLFALDWPNTRSDEPSDEQVPPRT